MHMGVYWCDFSILSDNVLCHSNAIQIIYVCFSHCKFLICDKMETLLGCRRTAIMYRIVKYCVILSLLLLLSCILLNMVRFCDGLVYTTKIW